MRSRLAGGGLSRESECVEKDEKWWGGRGRDVEAEPETEATEKEGCVERKETLFNCVAHNISVIKVQCMQYKIFQR